MINTIMENPAADNAHCDHIACEQAGGITIDRCRFTASTADGQVLKIASNNTSTTPPIDTIPTNITIQNCIFESPVYSNSWMIRVFNFNNVNAR